MVTLHLPERLSPQGKRVSLFVTCIVDLLYPQIGLSSVSLLEHLGCAVDFPQKQTCCGQPAFNSGYRGDAKAMARQFLKAFDGAEVIVTPSGSCAAMVRHEYPALFADDPPWKARAERAAAITWEITEFVVEGLGVKDLYARLDQPCSVAFHDSCHGLRLLGLGSAARALVGSIENVTVETLTNHDVCCGFGGLFAVKMADVSGAMLGEKLAHIHACPAQTILLGDASCMMHINGGLKKQGEPERARHVVEFLAEALQQREQQP